MSDEISIQFTRFSAFYSPLIATIAGGFLKEEGLTPKHSIAPAGQVGHRRAWWPAPCTSASRRRRRASGRSRRARRRPPCTSPRSTRRTASSSPAAPPDPAFTWDKLEGKRVLVDHGGQPLAMFKYACHKRGLDFAAIQARRRAERPDGRARSARARATTSTSRGRRPQQLEHDRVGHVVASVGEAIGPVRLLEPGRHARRGSGRTWPGASCAPTARRAPGSSPRRPARGRRGGGARSSRRSTAAVLDRHHRLLPEARLLDAARGDHPPGLRGRARRLPARGPHHQAPPLRGRGRAAAGGLSHERSAGRHSRRRPHEQPGGAVVRPDAGLAGRGRHQGRGAGQGRPRPGTRSQDRPDADSLFFLSFNANKRSLTLNLKHPRGKEVFRTLLKTADVLLENFGPGVIERLGFGYRGAARAQPAPGLREHQGLRLVRAVPRLQELRADRAGDGRRHERHRARPTARPRTCGRRSATPAPACTA